MTMTDVSATDFAVIAYREDDRWEAEVLPEVLAADLSGLIHALRQQPSVAGTLGFVGVGDDFFIAVRVMGGEVSIFLSDVTAAADWPLASQVLTFLDIPVPEDDDLDQVLPAGDLSIFADLGLEEWSCALSPVTSTCSPTRRWPVSPGALSSVRRWNARSKSLSGPDPAR